VPVKAIQLSRRILSQPLVDVKDDLVKAPAIPGFIIASRDKTPFENRQMELVRLSMLIYILTSE
jgi:hypothetical protein